MLKHSQKLKSTNLERNIAELLRDIISSVPAIKLASFQEPIPEGPDWVGKIDAAGQTWTLVAEAKSIGQPRQIRAALNQLRHYLDIAPEPSYGVITAPFISPRSAKLIADAGFGYADLAGNVRLAFGTVYIERRAAENPFRARREQRSLFTRKAGRILRVLLTPPLRTWKVTELKDAADVSLGQVSNVRNLLLDRELAVADEDGLRVTRAIDLAHDWAESYKLPPRETFYTVQHGETLDGSVRRALTEAGRGTHAVLASLTAANHIAPYAKQASQFFYADEQGAAVLKRAMRLEKVSRGENIVLLESSEDDVFTGRIEPATGIWTTGLVQTWLDLTASGERGREAAEHLEREKLFPAWKRAQS